MRGVARIVALAIVIGPVALGCSENGKQDCIVVVDQTIDVQTTWTSGCVYLIQGWDLYLTAPLTIEPGVVVKFDRDRGPDLVLGENGTIIAQGTVTKPIIFTSWRDDENGGDTNGDGTVTQPAPGDWNSVDLNAHNGSVFENCRFYYGGGSTYLSTLTFGGDSRATVKDSIFAHNGGGKFGCCYYGALDLSGALAGSVITGNIFYDNELPMSFDVLFSLDDSNTFHNPDDPSETNRLQGIFLNTTDDIYTPLTWAETEVAFVVNDNQLWINDPGSLTLGDNVVLKFTEGSAIVYSGTNLFNYDGTGVAFTSLKDDYLKGDTNGDGDTTGAGQNDWIGIYNDGNSYYETWPNIYYDSY